MLVKFKAGLNEEEVKEMEAAYRAAFDYRKKLTEMISKDIEAEINKMLDEEFDERKVLESRAKIKAWKKILQYAK